MPIQSVRIPDELASRLSVMAEAMMFVYFAYALPLSFRIAHGFYDNGIWADRGFVPYAQIGGLTWREEREITCWC